MAENIFQAAFELHSSGEFVKAKKLYLDILNHNPNHFDALHLCGLISFQTMQFEEAEFFFLKALGVKSEFAPLHSNYGLTLHALKRFEDAIASYENAISIEPDYANAFNNRGNAMRELKRLDEALASYEKALLVRPQDSGALNSLGNVLRDLGRFDEALAHYDAAISVKFDDADAYNNRGVTLKILERFHEALESFEKAVFFQNNNAAAYNNLGNALKDLGRFDEALASYDIAVFLKSDNADALYNRGVALQEMGRLDEALESYQKATAIWRHYAEAYNNSGVLLQRLKRLHDAIVSYDRAISIKPDYADAFNNRGNALKELNRFFEALESYDKAILIKQNNAEAYNNRGLALQDIDRYDEALACYDKAISIKSDYVDALYNRGYVLKELMRFGDSLSSYGMMIDLEIQKTSCDEGYKNWITDVISIDFLPASFHSEDDIEKALITLDKMLTRCSGVLSMPGCSFSLHQALTDRFVFNLNGFLIAYFQKDIVGVMKKFSNLIHQALSVPNVTRSIKIRRSGKIRFGIASGLLKSHNGANWAYNWLAHLPDNYDFFTYAFNVDSDELTEKFASLGKHRSLRFGKNALEIMLSDELDILMLPDVGMTPASRILSCHRIAPIQFTAWGHPVTTGSPQIDYFLSSDLMEPKGAEAHYSEQLVRLPNLALYLDPPTPRQGCSQNFDLPTGRVVYGCLQALLKYLPQYDFVFPMIAKEAPKSVFVFLEGRQSYATSVLMQRLSIAFERVGLQAREHVKFLPRTTREGYLDLMSQMDVILDSIGWNGGNTSLQAIELGKAIVTTPGAFMRGRHTYAMFRMMGLEKHIANSIDDYILRAIQLGSDRGFRSQAELDILERKHLLYRDQSFIDAFDGFLKQKFAKLNPLCD